MKDFLGVEFHPTEMYKLINLMIERGENCRVVEMHGSPSVRFLDDSGQEIGDAICHSGSYGHEQGLLEIMGLGLNDDDDGGTVKGWMTAEEVVERLDGFRNGGFGGCDYGIKI